MIEGYLRRKLLDDIYSRMSDEEKRLFSMLVLQDRSHAEVMQALQRQHSQLDRLQRSQQTFAGDFLSNVAGNAAWDVLLWLARRLLR